MSCDGKKVFWAVCGSLLLHVLVLLTWALTSQWLALVKRPDVPPPIRLEIVKAEETPPPEIEATPTPTPRPFLDTSDRAPAEHPPDKPAFESGQDTVAASELPATGDKALPSLNGKKAVPVFAFNDVVHAFGDAPATAPPPPTEPPPPAPVAAPSPPPSTPRPTPAHTPVPDDEFGLATPTPTPDDPEPGVDPAQFRSPDSTMPPRPTVASRSANASDAVGFQADKESAAVSGNITKRGEASVDSAATPLGRYKNRVIGAISRQWTSYFYSRNDLVGVGMVRIHTIIDRRGKILPPKILSNSANEALASVSVQALMDAPIPPIPPDALVLLPKGELPLDLTFDSE